MSYTYTYSISSHFPGGAVNTDKFKDEINKSTILTALDTNAGEIVINPNGDDVDRIDVIFKAQLSAGDETTFDGDVGTGPAGGLIGSHDNTPGASRHEVDLVNVAVSADGVIPATPQASTPGYRMCDRDIKLNTCQAVASDSFEDLRMDISTNDRVNWDEVTLVGVYKDDGTNGIIQCTGQTDADVTGILSVWEYQAHDQTAQKNPIKYDIRGGSLLIASAISGYDHQAYVVAAPGVPVSYGGQIPFFDGYLGPLSGETLTSVNPAAVALDPSQNASASVIRIYIWYPAGAKVTHVLRLVTYRPSGKW